MIKQRSLTKLVVLSLLTCGFYGIFFWWGYINDINNACVCDGKKSPNFLIVMVLSTLTCGLYYLVWLYRQGERLKYMAPSYGLNFKEGGGAVLIYHLLGTFVLNAAFSIGSMAAMANDKYSVAVAGFNDAALRDAVAALNIPPDASLLLLFCSVVLCMVGITMVLNSISILIVNLNAVGKVYNSRIFNTW